MRARNGNANLENQLKIIPPNSDETKIESLNEQPEPKPKAKPPLPKPTPTFPAR